MKDLIKIFVVWRVFLFLPVIIAGFFLPLGSSSPFFEISFYQKIPSFLNYPILTAWSNFDGVHYLNIVSRGYEAGARFFPLLPMIIYLLSLGNIYFPLTYIISIILPNVIFTGALIMFSKLLKLDYPEKISKETIFYLIFFPTSFFFISVYTEGLFLLLTVLSFYFMRKKQWFYASLFAALLSSSRLVGVFILPALIYEYLTQEKNLNLKKYIYLMLFSLISTLGLVSYSIYNYFRWNNFLYFLQAQGELNNGRSTSSLVFPLQTVYRYFKILTSLSAFQFEWWIALVELLSFFIGCGLLFVAWKKKVRTSYLIFGTLAFLIPVLSGTFSGLPRYLLVLFPIFIALALLNSKKLKIFYLIFCVVISFLLLMFFTRAYFVA